MASKIDPKVAQNLIKEFRDQNKSSSEHALKTPEGQHLHGFFVDRETMENILADKDNAGMHVLLAKHPDFTGKDDKVHTALVMGSKPNTAHAPTFPPFSCRKDAHASVCCAHE